MINFVLGVINIKTSCKVFDVIVEELVLFNIGVYLSIRGSAFRKSKKNLKNQKFEKK